MNDRYGVKVVYRKKAGDEIFYEEQILCVEAESFDQAYEKVETYAETFCDEYVNPYGQKVRVEQFYLLDCYLANDQEVYSRIFKNPFEEGEEKLLSILECHSPAEEMYALRNAEFNRPQNKQQIGSPSDPICPE